MMRPILKGGPHHMKILTLDFDNRDPPVELRFPMEPVPPFRGHKSLSAPQPTKHGRAIYKWSGKWNFLEDPIYEYQYGN